MRRQLCVVAGLFSRAGDYATSTCSPAADTISYVSWKVWPPLLLNLRLEPPTGSANSGPRLGLIRARNDHLQRSPADGQSAWCRANVQRVRSARQRSIGFDENRG